MKVNKLNVGNESELRDSLDTLYAKGKENEEFFGLLELMTNRETFLTAIHNIKSNKGSKTAGIDRKIVDDYLKMNKDKAYEMVLRKFNDYRPIPTRRMYIPKGADFEFKQKDGKELLKQKKVRPLGIPAMVDRIVQEMMRIVLEPIFEAQFFPHSYGFRPYRATEHSLAWVLKIINGSKLYHVVEGDIEGYFDNINHNKLIAIMWNMGIKDQRVLSIIKKMLKSGYMDCSEFYETHKGTPQGGIISPLLANIYLNNFDWMLAEEYEFHKNNVNFKEKKNALASLRSKGKPPIFYIRYADDWIILTDSLQNAERLKKKCEKYLKTNLDLNLSAKKTLITDVRETKVKFLGFTIKAGKQRSGGNQIVARLIPDMEKVSRKVNEIQKIIRFIRTRKSETEKALDIEKINSKIVGLTNYYRIGIAKDIFGTIDNRLEKTAYKTWVNMHGKYKAKGYKVPVSEFGNRIDRHKGYSMKNFMVMVDDVKVGITMGKITKIEYAKVFKQEMSPYTVEGRELYEKKSGNKARLISRPNLIDTDDLYVMINSEHTNHKYNLEYFLNREYAYNRDIGKCKICEIEIYSGNYHCHHINPFLPLDKINKVHNLASLCKACHMLVHNDKEVFFPPKMAGKLMRYRKRAKDKPKASEPNEA
ncbi:group II intron reverse transcriptase/maturase [Viridibacillus arvi]|uniref:group II intron reverse transcriptase/maturase n=1 Tax=Viridibacillus arvi TaxID=263475 RepID=UPI003D011749